MITEFTSEESTFEMEEICEYNGTLGSIWAEWRQKTTADGCPMVGRVFNGRAFVAGSRPTREDVERCLAFFAVS
jgi:hypothetical protein